MPSEKNDFFGIHIPFMQYIGLQTRHIETGFARTFLSLRDDLTNSRGDMHGGTMMSVLDFTLSAAARGHDPLGLGVATIEMSTHFLAPARSELTFEGRVLRRGRSIAFCEGSALDADGKQVCTARATFRLIHLNRDQNE